MIGSKKNQNQNLKKDIQNITISSAYRLWWYIGYNNGIWKFKPLNSAQKVSVITIAKQASAWHFWVFLSTNFLFRQLAKEGRKIGEIREKNAWKLLYTHGTRYLSWINSSWEQRLAIGARAMYIACNDTSVIMINFWKSKTHAITDTYCTGIFAVRINTKEEQEECVQRTSVLYSALWWLQPPVLPQFRAPCADNRGFKLQRVLVSAPLVHACSYLRKIWCNSF